MKNSLLFVALCLAIASPCRADYSYQGYFRNSTLYQNLSQDSGKSIKSLDNLSAARQIIRYYPGDFVRVGLELKEQFIWGKQAETWNQTLESFGQGGAYFNWRRSTSPQFDELLTVDIDRFWLDLNHDNLQLTAGRQRIAWGTNLVWNPIDIFNPSSPLDFDNEEKPGGDAVRIQLYTGDVTKIEAAVEARRNEASTYAGLIKLNFLDYDIFALAGHKTKAMLAGFAWVGDIKGAGFRGEFLQTIPETNSNGKIFNGALSADYTFTNSFYIHSEVLYNSAGADGLISDAAWERSATENWLSPAMWSIFAETAYGFSPLIRGGIAGIVNPGDKSWYVTPSFSYSVSTDVDLGVLFITTGGNSHTEFGGMGSTGVFRLKYSY